MESLHVSEGFNYMYMYEDDEGGLFDPPPPRNTCPLCLITLPCQEEQFSTYYACCGKTICNGCIYKQAHVLAKKNARRAAKDPPEPPLKERCPFCRSELPVEDEMIIDLVRKSVERNDPEAYGALANLYSYGSGLLERNLTRAAELYIRGAELGDAQACYYASKCFFNGEGVQRNTLKARHYLILAAKKGHINARYSLGAFDNNAGKFELAYKHWQISASGGHAESVEQMLPGYKAKMLTKDEYETTLRAYQKAKEDMQSEERDKAGPNVATRR